MRTHSWACASSQAACSASRSESTSMTLSATGAAGEKGVLDMLSEFGIGELMIFSLLHPCFISSSASLPDLYSELRHDNSLEFQPLFRTPLLRMAPRRLSIGHPFLRISGRDP